MKRVRLAPTTQSCGNLSLVPTLIGPCAASPSTTHGQRGKRLPHRNHHFANRAANEHRRGDQALRRFKRRVAPCPSTEAHSPPMHLALNINPLNSRLPPPLLHLLLSWLWLLRMTTRAALSCQEPRIHARCIAEQRGLVGRTLSHAHTPSLQAETSISASNASPARRKPC
jgi:hypothetical protein